ncbi:MAG: hypothetical protein RJA99_667 [Pseudomonadota bacterium]|jgi:hypothetical protein
MEISDLVERLLASQREHGGGFADALARLDDAWFHALLELAQSARIDQDDGQAAITEVAIVALAMETETDDEISAPRLGGAFFEVLDSVEAERRRRAG